MGDTSRAGVARPEHVLEIVVLYCQRCVDPDAGVVSGVRTLDGCRVKLVAMACTSKIELPYLLRIVEQGADGVQVVGCPEKACRFQIGSLMATRRVERARKLLDEVGMGAERLAIHLADGLTAKDLEKLAGDLATRTRALGPNPMKGGTQR
jgi:coenzyme F420-reducing hydrogenase delta subunit